MQWQAWKKSSRGKAKLKGEEGKNCDDIVWALRHNKRQPQTELGKDYAIGTRRKPYTKREAHRCHRQRLSLQALRRQWAMVVWAVVTWFRSGGLWMWKRWDIYVGKKNMRLCGRKFFHFFINKFTDRKPVNNKHFKLSKGCYRRISKLSLL